MRQWIGVAALLCLAATVCSAQDAAQAPALKTQKEKVSYVIGTIVAKDMKKQGIDLNADLFVKGFRDVLSGAKLAVSDKDAQETMNAFKTEMVAKKAGGSENNRRGEQEAGRGRSSARTRRRKGCRPWRAGCSTR